jgi:hypothetical protein
LSTILLWMALATQKRAGWHFVAIAPRRAAIVLRGRCLIGINPFALSKLFQDRRHGPAHHRLWDEQQRARQTGVQSPVHPRPIVIESNFAQQVTRDAHRPCLLNRTWAVERVDGRIHPTTLEFL